MVAETLSGSFSSIDCDFDIYFEVKEKGEVGI